MTRGLRERVPAVLEEIQAELEGHGIHHQGPHVRTRHLGEDRFEVLLVDGTKITLRAVELVRGDPDDPATAYEVKCALLGGVSMRAACIEDRHRECGSKVRSMDPMRVCGCECHPLPKKERARFWLGPWEPQQPTVPKGVLTRRAIGEEHRRFRDYHGREVRVCLEEYSGGWKWVIRGDGQTLKMQPGFGSHLKSEGRQRAERAAREYAKLKDPRTP